MNLALFDFDGTITSADTFTPFVRLAAGRSRVLAGSAILSPLLLGYALGVSSDEEGARRSSTAALSGDAPVNEWRRSGPNMQSP